MLRVGQQGVGASRNELGLEGVEGGAVGTPERGAFQGEPGAAGVLQRVGVLVNLPSFGREDGNPQFRHPFGRGGGEGTFGSDLPLHLAQLVAGSCPGIYLHLPDGMCRGINQVDIAVETSVEVEVGHVGGNRFRVAAVVATDGDGYLPTEAFTAGGVGAELFHSLRDVGFPFVVSTSVRGHKGGVDVDFGILSRAFKLQVDAPVLIRAVYVEGGAIPSGTLVVVRVGIHRIFGVEAMGQGDFLPEGDGFGLSGSGHGAHHFPDAAHVLTDELPIRRKALFAVGGDEGGNAVCP